MAALRKRKPTAHLHYNNGTSQWKLNIHFELDGGLRASPYIEIGYLANQQVPSKNFTNHDNTRTYLATSYNYIEYRISAAGANATVNEEIILNVPPKVGIVIILVKNSGMPTVSIEGGVVINYDDADRDGPLGGGGPL